MRFDRANSDGVTTAGVGTADAAGVARVRRRDGRRLRRAVEGACRQLCAGIGQVETLEQRLLMAAPDLQVTGVGFSASSVVQSGNSVVVVWNDVNNGDAATPTASWYDTVKVTNTTTGQVLVNNSVTYNPATTGNGAIGVGESRQRMYTFTLPHGAAGAGAMELKVTADAGGAVAEVNTAGNAEQNNQTVATATSAVAPYADLVVSNVRTTPAAPVSGQAMTIQWDDVNQGAGPTSTSWYDRVTVVNTTTGQTLVGGSLVYYDRAAAGNGDVAAGGVRTRSYSCTLPHGSAGAGNLQISVDADYGGGYLSSTVMEYDATGAAAEANNAAVADVTAAVAPYADLVVANVRTTPSTPQSGQSVTIQWDDVNQGTGPTSTSWYDRLTVVNTTTGQTLVGGALIYYDRAAAGNGDVPGGGSRGRSYTFTLPHGSVGAGDLRITVDADYGGGYLSSTVTEYTAAGASAEGNNSTAATVASVVAPYADLVVSNIRTTPATPQSGQAVTIQWDDVNQGTGPTSTSWYDRVTVVNTTTGQTLVGGALVYYDRTAAGNGDIAAGGDVRTRSYTFTLPHGSAGVGNLRITVDTDSGTSYYAPSVIEYTAAGAAADANNSLTATVAAVVYPYADLVVSNVRTDPSTPLSGQQVTIRWDDVNRGAGPTGTSWYDRVTVVNTTTGQTLVGGAYVYYDRAAAGNGDVAAGDARARSYTFTLPHGAQGAGNLRVTIDADSGTSYYAPTVIEYDTAGSGMDGNNSAVLNVGSAVAPYADLVVTNIRTTPATPLSGQAVTVQWDDRNQGTGPTSTSWYDRVTIVNTTTNQTLVNGAYVYYDRAAAGNGDVAAGDVRTRGYTFTLPHGASGAGNLRITVDADSGAGSYGPTVMEYDATGLAAESNNSATANVTAAVAPYADLVVANVRTTPATPQSGQAVTIQWDDVNQGTGPTATSWYDRVSVVNTTTGQTLVNGAYVYYDRTLAANGDVTAGGTRARSFTFTLPHGSAGAGNLRVTVDTDTGAGSVGPTVIEYTAAGASAEANNGATFNVASIVAPYADLVVSNLRAAPATPLSGQQVTIQWEDVNQGTGPTGTSWYDRVTVVNSRTGQTLLNGAYVYYDAAAAGNGPLAPGARAARGYTFTLPSGSAGAGTLHITVATDTGAGSVAPTVIEYDAAGAGAEGNNTTVADVTSSVAPSPDLVVTGVAVDPAAPLSGQPVTVRWIDRNQGSGPTAASWYDRVTVVNTTTGQTLVNGAYVYYDRSAAGNGDVGAGEERARSFTFTLPHGSAGAGNLRVTVDTDTGAGSVAPSVVEFDNLGGSAEGNNSATANATAIVAPYADLVISNIRSTPAAPLSGQSMTIQWDDVNQGSGPTATSWYDRLTVVNTTTGQTLVNGAYVYYDRAGAGNGDLAAGDARTRSFTFTLPQGSAGAGTLRITVDTDVSTNYYAPSVIEYTAAGASAEGNNSAVATVMSTVAPYADLIVANVRTTPATPQSGQQMTIQWDDINQGTGPTGTSWYDRLTVINMTTGQTLVNGAYVYYDRAAAGNGDVPAAGGTRARNFTFTLPHGSPGAGNLRITVDADVSTNYYAPTVVEYDAAGNPAETNNSATANVTSVVAPYADLVVANVSTDPATPLSGRPVTIRWQDVNQGTGGTSTSWYERVTVVNTTTGQTLVNGAYVYYDRSAAGNGDILAGESRDRSFAFTLPNGAAGAGALRITVDADVSTNYYAPTVIEYDAAGAPAEANNSAAVTVTSVVSPYADLVVSNVRTEPAAPASGQSVTVRWDDVNQGTGAAAASWYDRVTVVNTTTAQTLVSGAYVYYDRAAAGNGDVAGGDARTRNFTFNLPQGAAGAGNLRITVEADTGTNYYGPAIIEYDAAGAAAEANNTATANVTSTVAPYADLVVRDVTLDPAAPQSGQQVTIRWKTANQGTGPTAVSWFDRITVVNTTTGQTLVGGVSVYYDRTTAGNGDLAPGDERARTFTFTLPHGGAGAGNLRVTVEADAGSNYYGSAVTEYDVAGASAESNNAATVNVAAALAPYPDLRVTGVTGPDEAYTGEQIRVTWTVTNLGTAAATGAWRDTVSLSADDAIGNDRGLQSYAFSGTIGIGQSVVRTQVVTLPDDAAGTFRLVVKANGDLGLLEYPTDNNESIAAATTLIRVSPRPNLQVAAVTAPATAFSGQQATVTWTVMNAGTGEVRGTNWSDGVWLSHDAVLDASDVLLGSAYNYGLVVDAGGGYSGSLAVTLPKGISGSYRFLVGADYNNSVREFDYENDNVRAGAVTNVQLTPPPDLRVSTVSAPLQAFSGEPMHVTWAVENAGTGATVESTWYDDIYLSTDATFDAADRLLSRRYHTGVVAAGASYAAAADVIPPVGTDGSFYVFVKTDSLEQVFEHAFEANNTGFDATPVVVHLTPPPDLEVQSVATPAELPAGRSLTVAYRVVNAGAAATPATQWLDTFYLSADPVLDPLTDVYLGTKWHSGALDAGAGYDGTAALTLPNTLAGACYVIVATDRAKSIFELDYANNVGASAAAAAAVSRPADLVVSAVTVPATVTAGGSATVGWTVTNQGTGDSASTSWVDRVVVSRDAVAGNADDVTLGTFTHTGLLDVGQGYTRRESVGLPFQLDGAYHLFVVADAYGQVYEGAGEGNDASAPANVQVLRQVPDLQVTAITAPASAASGAPLTVAWTVTNAGAGDANASTWYDEVYLSTDAQYGAADVYLGRVYHSGGLTAGGQYQASGTFTLPADLEGPYFVLVRTDASQSVTEDAGESNNTSATPAAVPVTLTPVPNLAVTAVTASAVAVAGQTLTVSWGVANSGASTSANAYWYDYAYLSADQVLDASDVALGYADHVGGLQGGQVYAASRAFNLPAGLTGQYYVFVVVDRGNSVYERQGEQDNAGVSVATVSLTAAAKADLRADSVTAAANATVGDDTRVDYVVTNAGLNAAVGAWDDAVYLSADDRWDPSDVLLGRAHHTGGLAVGASYTGSVTAAVPGVNPGDYHFIVRADVGDAVAESDSANNRAASADTSAIAVAPLALGAPVTGTLRQGRSVYFAVDVTAGQTLSVSFDAAAATAVGRMYVRFGDVPTAGTFDVSDAQEVKADHLLTVPRTLAGMYYVMVQGEAGGDTAFTIAATTLTFGLTAIDTPLAHSAGPLTLRVQGSKFDRGTRFQLAGPGGAVLDASDVTLQDSSVAFVTFDLQGAAAGTYDVRAIQTGTGGATATLAGALAVSAGSGGQFSGTLNGPSEIRPNTYVHMDLSYGNTGHGDLYAPIMVVTSPDGVQFGLDRQSFADRLMVIGLAPDNPANVLRPGRGGLIPLEFKSPGSRTTVSFKVDYLFADDTRPVDWAAMTAALRPGWMGDAAWNAAVAAFRSRIDGHDAVAGATYGELVRALGETARRLATRGGRTFDVRRLLATELTAAAGRQTGVVAGRLIDHDTGRPLAGITVFLQTVSADGELATLPNLAMTDADGEFSVRNLPAGTYVVVPAGYEVPIGGNQVTVTATRDAVGLELETRSRWYTPTPTPEEPAAPAASAPSVDSDIAAAFVGPVAAAAAPAAPAVSDQALLDAMNHSGYSYYDPASGTPAPALPPGHTAVKSFNDVGLNGQPGTGFQATAITDANGNLTIAFRGTSDLQDAFADLRLVMPQWEANKAAVFSYVRQYMADHPDASLTFTGHSLGGGLAQLAAYDSRNALTGLRDAVPDEKLSLVTFNGVGIVDAIKDRDGGIYSPAQGGGFASREVIANGDLVGLLGGGHLSTPQIVGGLIEFFTDAHVLANFTSMPTAQITSPGRPVQPSEYLKVELGRQILEAFANAGNSDGQADARESVLRLIAALTHLDWADTTTKQELANWLFKNLHDSGKISDANYERALMVNWSRVIDVVTNLPGVKAVGEIALLKAVLEEPKVGQFINNLVDKLHNTMDAISKGLQTAGDFIEKAARDVWDGLKTAATAVGDAIASAVDVAKTAFYDAITAIGSGIEYVADAVHAAMNKAVEVFRNTLDTVKDALISAGAAAADAITSAVNAAAETFANVVDYGRQLASDLIAAGVQAGTDILDAAADMATTAAAAAVDAANAIKDGVTTVVGGAVDAAASAIAPVIDLSHRVIPFLGGIVSGIFGTTVIIPRDPNDIVGPAGAGDAHWIAARDNLPYTIRFENAPDANAPAQQVVVRQQLDADLDWRTFRLGDFGWGGGIL